MNVRFPLAISFAILGLATSACSSGGQQTPANPPLAGARIGVPFALTDGDGRTVRDTDFAGKYRIVYFGYTYCPDVCPTDSQHIGAALRLLEERNPALAARIVPIFISVDPARDTPEVVGKFVAAFHPRMVGLTGSAAAIAAVAKGYGVFFQAEPAAPGGGYMVTHSQSGYLMDPAGKPLALLPVEKAPEEIVTEIEKWAK
jgi:protein SCO1/2